MKRISIFLFLLILVTTSLFANSSRVITVEDLFSFGRVSDPQISPDGKWISYSVKYYYMDTNKNNGDIWLVSTKGGEPVQLTTSPKSDFGARWSPCGKCIAFISTRNGSPQIFKISMQGGEAKQLSDISTGANGIVWSPDGKYIAFSSETYPDLKTDEENQVRDEEKENSLVKAKIIDRLLFRYWNHWTDEKRNHVLVMKSIGGEAWDVTPGDYDSPPLDLGSSHDYCFSPDSKTIAFVRNMDPVPAISTNNDIFSVAVEGGKINKITDNKANDNHPTYSPDGRYLAYRAMERPGFEADQYDLILLSRKTGAALNLTPFFDRSVGNFKFSPDEKYIYFTAQNHGRINIYRVSVKGGKVEQVIESHYIRDFCLSPDNKFLYFSQEAINLPTEIFRCKLNEKTAWTAKDELLTMFLSSVYGEA